MNIAFFDFDGTMSKRDSLFVFVRFLVGERRFFWGIVSRFWILLGYMLRIYSNSTAKQALTRYFFKGLDERYFNVKCQEFEPILASLVRDSALSRLEWHKARGDKVIMVSASFEAYLKPLCERLEMECIATKLESINGILSGEFDGENCYGEQKAIRIKAAYNLQAYQEIYAYGDSSGDTQMLALATQKFYRYFA